MSELKEFIAECQPVLLASELYADYFNSLPISGHIKKIIGKSKVKVAPYCYFHLDKIDYEKAKGNGFDLDLHTDYYKVETIDFQNIEHINKYLVPLFKKHLPKTFTSICGVIGVPIFTEDTDAEQDHYVAYLYKDNVLHYFDSAIDDDFASTETFNILVSTFNPKSVERNTKTFEEAGGVSENPFNYVAQNIFCHSWCMWFLEQIIVNNMSLKDIDKLAGKGVNKNKNNLILIKTYIYNSLIPKLGLEKLKSFGLFDYFRFIIINSNKLNIKEII